MYVGTSSKMTVYLKAFLTIISYLFTIYMEPYQIMYFKQLNNDFR